MNHVGYILECQELANIYNNKTLLGNKLPVIR